jgi:PAS domain S-box-containing protein
VEDYKFNMSTEYESILQSYAPLIVEHLPVGVALFDARNLHMVATNRRYPTLLNSKWQQGRAIGHHLTEVLPANVPVEEVSALVEVFRRVAETGESYHYEEYAFPSTGHGMTYWDWKLDPIHENGRVSYLLLSATDVTSQVEARLRVEQDHAALAQAHSAVEMEKQRIKYCEIILANLRNMSEPKELASAVLSAIDSCFSPSLQALYVIQPGQDSLLLLASRIHDGIVQNETPIFAPFISPKNRFFPDQMMCRRDPVIRQKHQAGKEKGTKDALFDLPTLEQVVYFPLWREQQCEGILVVAFAGEDKANELLMKTLSSCAPRLAEALTYARLHTAIADEKQRLYAILDQLPEGILLVEVRTSKVSYANPAAAHLLGIALQQFLGAPLNQSALMSPHGLSKQNQRQVFRWNFALIHALWGRTITNQELLITRPDGSEIPVLSSVAPIRMPGGMISGAVIVFQDISLLKQLEQQKDEFFAVANHELRTPLTIIMGFAELLHLRTDDNTDAMYQYATTSIMQECEHLLRLIHDLLDVSHLEHGGLKMKKCYQDLLVPLRQTVDKYAHTTETHTLRFVLEDIEPADFLMGQFDIPRIEQALTNLISNAIKYSPVGSEVEVGVRPYLKADGVIQEVLIWVKDQGNGIASSDLPRVFERFYRADDTSRSAGGFGIGLYLTKELIQNHDGRIWVKSTKGKGSTFFVVLPLQEAIMERAGD